MTNRALRGGSAGEPAKLSALPYFHDGVKATELIQKNTYGLRLLPAFEFDLDTMVPKNALSVQPYRDPNNVDPQTQRPVFTEWYFALKVHKMIGNGMRSFVSPLLLERSDARDIDPLHNIYLTARSSDLPEWRGLTEKAKDEMNADLRRYRVSYAVNALMPYDNKLENRITVMTGESLMQLKKKLDLRGGRGDEVLDPNWPDYCFGDVTSPEYGLWATVKPGVFNDAGMKTSLFYFGNQPQDDRPIGVTKYPFPRDSDYGQAWLAGRYNIADIEKVTRISTPEQIIAYLVDDGCLPHALIEQACGHRWDVPSQTKRRTHFTAPATQGAAEVPVGYAPAPAAAPIPAAVAERRFWMLVGGQAKGPFPEKAVRDTVTAMRADIQVCQEGDNNWYMASQFGITPPPAPVPSAPVPPPTPIGHTAPGAPMMPPPPSGAMVPPPPIQRPAAPPVLAPAAPPMQPAMPPTMVAPPAAMPPGMPPRPGSVPTAGTSNIPAMPPPPPAGSSAPPPLAAGPFMMTRPAPVQPPLQAPPPPMQAPPPPMQAPAPPAAPAPPFAAAPAMAPQPQQPQALPPVAAAVPLNQAELAEYTQLFDAWTKNGGQGSELLNPAQVARFSELSDRVSASNMAAQ